MEKRLYHLDWIRFIVVALLVPFHIALTYTGTGDSYVYHEGIKAYYLGLNETPEFNIWSLKLFVDFLSCFFMQLLFVIAGISANFALKNRSYKDFIKDRFFKLIIPTLLGMLTIIPITSWIRNINLFNYQGHFFEFYPLFFNGIRGTFPEANLEWGHMWFLVYLFVITLMVLPLSKFLNKIESKRIFVIFLIILTIFEMIFRPGWPGFQNLVDDWANLTNYIFLYLFGFIISNKEVYREKINKGYLINLFIGVALYILLKILNQITDVPWGYNGYTITTVAIRSFVTFLIILGVLGLGNKFLNRENRHLKVVKQFSFPLYILHYVPSTLVTFFIIKTDLPIGLQFFIAVTVSYPLIFLLFKMIKNIPIVKKLIGF